MTKQRKNKKQKFVTPAGIAVYPWLNRPDTKAFDDKPARPQFKVKLKFTPLEFEAPCKTCNGMSLKELLDGVAEAGYEQALEEKPKRQKPRRGQAFQKYVAYTDELDDEGDPTGNILVNFSQNAEIKRKDGEVVKVTIPLFDRAGEATDVPIFGGSLIKAAFTTRSFANDAAYMGGATLDLSAVQVLKAVKTARTADAFGFEAEDDEDEADPDDWGNASGDGGDDDDLDDEIPF